MRRFRAEGRQNRRDARSPGQRHNLLLLHILAVGGKLLTQQLRQLYLFQPWCVCVCVCGP